MENERTRETTSRGDFERLYARIEQIFRQEINVDLSTIDVDTDLRQQVYLDSMEIAEVYAAIRKEFQVELPTSILAATTLRQMLDILQKEIAAGTASDVNPPLD